MAHSRLSLTDAQSKISDASHKAVIQRFQEYRLLLKIGEDGRKLSNLDPQTALTLARLARETLASEYELADRLALSLGHVTNHFRIFSILFFIFIFHHILYTTYSTYDFYRFHRFPPT